MGDLTLAFTVKVALYVEKAEIIFVVVVNPSEIVQVAGWAWAGGCGAAFSAHAMGTGPLFRPPQLARLPGSRLFLLLRHRARVACSPAVCQLDMLHAPVNTVDPSWSATSNSPLGSNVKGSLGFIMNAADVAEPHWFAHDWEVERGATALDSPPASAAEKSDAANPATPAKVSAKLSGKTKAKVRRTLSYEEKRRSRECKVDGCENYIINKGLCFRHGVRLRAVVAYCFNKKTYRSFWMVPRVGRSAPL
ncbi:unnamed protein product [Phytophthora lilii]|uniref:Unnamed protein product n=1 Tax=Phytophthora lilii TaxID=2077276 RepID=A0A9W6WTZ2_9STRA|nr:unnamed protein product [Phytophthora lilii]